MKGPMRVLAAWMLLMAAGVANAGDAPSFDVGTSPLMSQEDANNRCPSVCENAHGTWNGQWTNTPPSGAGSVCGCYARPARQHRSKRATAQ